VTDQPSNPTDKDSDPFAIDTSVAHPARVQDALLGGDDNFTADREVVELISDALPGGVDTARVAVRALGKFVGRTVRYLTVEVGIRQFLNVGVGIPKPKNVHQVAQQAAPDARFVYVGNDPVVLAHAHSLRTSTPEGATAYLHGSLHDPQAILQGAAATLDFDRPIAVVLPTTLNFVHDDDDPYGLLARLLKTVPSGSYLVVAHASYDIEAEGMTEAADRLSTALSEVWVVRGQAEIARFFDGLDMVNPGLVQIDQWRPYGEGEPIPLTGRTTPIFGAVARKP
jgi:hypothetical protein